MENVSKALLIAGGTLLAMMTISLFMFMRQNVKTIGLSQEESIAKQQLSEFNAEYEAFNKRAMYGTDVCTLFNKAIEYNGGLGASESDFFINIELTLTQDFTNVIITKTTSGITRQNDGTTSLARGTYELKGGSSNISMNETILNFFNSSIERQETETKTIYNAISDFRKAIFRCTEIEYNSNTGRVSLIKIEQKSAASY